MEKREINIERLLKVIDTLSKYSDYLQSELHYSGNVKIHEGVFLDLAFRHKENMKGVVILMDRLITDDFIKVPLASILRSLTADALTSLYLYTLLNDSNEVQTTFTNEIRWLNIEFRKAQREIAISENGNVSDISSELSELLNDKKTNFKTRNDIHKTSAENLLSQKMMKGVMLSESMKLGHIEEKYSKHDIYKVAKRCFTFNKYFTQYYHYNTVGGEIGRTFTNDEIEFFYKSIAICIFSFISSFSVIKRFFSNEFRHDICIYLDELHKKLPNE